MRLQAAPEPVIQYGQSFTFSHANGHEILPHCDLSFTDDNILNIISCCYWSFTYLFVTC